MTIITSPINSLLKNYSKYNRYPVRSILVHFEYTRCFELPPQFGRLRLAIHLSLNCKLTSCNLQVGCSNSIITSSGFILNNQEQITSNG